jgi:16S rRNA (guanine966-N2)-methyltransferase
MRIIAGGFGGRRIHSPEGRRIRPTIDRVREAVFSMIGGHVAGAMVLDLFAGTGAFGLEALSRGASFCCFVDNGTQALDLIRANIELCAVKDRTRIVQASALSALRRLKAEEQLFDLVFLDPPYGKGYVEETLTDIGPVLGEGALVIAERHVKDLQAPSLLSAWQLFRERRYGDTLISIYTRSEESR